MLSLLYIYFLASILFIPIDAAAILVDNEDGTITDTKTGLMWQKNYFAPTCWKGAFCELEDMTLAGYTDWRLPTHKELLSIVDNSSSNPSINETYFPNTASSNYWTSDNEDESDPPQCVDCYEIMISWAHGYSIDFSNGETEVKNNLERLYVRTVRGISSPYILTPTAGTTLILGNSVDISWETQKFSENVEISISRSGGKNDTFEIIAENTDNDGHYRWRVTDPNSPNCMIKIASLENPSNYDIQGFFSINTQLEAVSKAIIVAGGGDIPGNNLWEATHMCANYAYRSLCNRAYDKNTVYYLSHNTNIDLDGNGMFDDIDDIATNINFEYAINEWAKDAKDLFLYMIDHGGIGTFRMSATETLKAIDLDIWLDRLQNTMPGKIIMIYDACRSGSFIPLLTPPNNKDRILICSASNDENSIFIDSGTISFSFLFWARILNGDTLYDSYYHAKNSIRLSYQQTPQLDANGNGIPNEKGDDITGSKILIDITSGDDIPYIGKVSANQLLVNKNQAHISAEDVTDSNGIQRVWTVINPPDYISSNPDNPILDLPILDLNYVEKNRYESIYTEFTHPGNYQITIFAMDHNGTISLPRQTVVTRINFGDINNDNSIDLADAIISLKILSGLPYEASFVRKIELKEVIYILQNIN
jgi:hypothetical protein